jgi:CRP-like cAMP-binding protein
MAFVQKGSVVINDMFDRFNISVLLTGSFFGEYELFQGAPSQFTYRANPSMTREELHS